MGSGRNGKENLPALAGEYDGRSHLPDSGLTPILVLAVMLTIKRERSRTSGRGVDLIGPKLV